MISLLIFTFGLAVGSFLNSVLFRMENGKSALRGRSSCPQCTHPLVWYDLIPLLSFVFLKGKCRYCNQQISFQYPSVELATGFLFLLVFFSLGEQPVHLYSLFTLGYLFTLVSLLVAIFVYDLKHFIIPDKFIYPAILVSGIWYLARLASSRGWVSGIFFDSYTRYEIQNTIYATIGAAIFFFLIHALSKGRAMGFGDVKFAFFMGLFLGWPNILVALFFAFFLGALIGIFLVLSRKKEWKSQVPFGPFLVTGTFIALLLGDDIVAWYLDLVLV